jgi:hypothetical protein
VTAADPAQPLQRVEQPLEARQVAERGLVGLVARLVRSQIAAVAVVGQPVGAQRPEAAAGAGAQPAQGGVAAGQRPQEGQRPGLRVAAERPVPAGRQRAEPHAARAVGGADRRVGGAVELAVEVRRDGRAGRGRRGTRRTGVLRLQPQRDVRLVPDDVAVHGPAVAGRHGPREAPEQVGSRVAALAALRRPGDGPQRPRAGDHEHDAQPRAVGEAHRPVQPPPAVAGVRRVGRVEARRGPPLGHRGRDLLPFGEDPHGVSAAGHPRGDRRGRPGVAALVQQRGVVGDPDRQLGRRGRRPGRRDGDPEPERGEGGGGGAPQRPLSRARRRSARPPWASSRRSTTP